MKLNERLVELRKSRNLTQEDVAELLNVSRQAVYKWESGKGYPTIDKFVFIKNHFGIDFNFLLEDMTKQKDIKIVKQSLRESIQDFYFNLSKADQRIVQLVSFLLIGSFLFSLGILLGVRKIDLSFESLNNDCNSLRKLDHSMKLQRYSQCKNINVDNLSYCCFFTSIILLFPKQQLEKNKGLFIL